MIKRVKSKFLIPYLDFLSTLLNSDYFIYDLLRNGGKVPNKVK